MPASEPTHDRPGTDKLSASARRGFPTQLILVALFIVLVLIAVFLPPYLNVSRYQRRIAANLSAALGRPVHLDRVSLSLFPLPGFTLENFVVDEDPAFGSEPILRADTVRANVRISSLWGRRVEFSRISLTDPHVNLVHLPDGRWNLQSILLQASRTEAAPTTQKTAGPALRFPYIEATGARLNLKLGQQKTPYSLTEADFALWLPEPRQWHFRLESHAARTDIAPVDSGLLRLDGTLGGALATTLAETPIDLHANLQDAPLGGLSHLLLGRDAGLRGDLNLDLHVLGTVGQASIATTLQLAHARRADFVPPHLLSLDIACTATAQDAFHAIATIECHWPPTSSSDHSLLIASATIPDTCRPTLSSVTITLPAIPTATLLDWLRAATPHPPTAFLPTGTLAGSLAWNAVPKLVSRSTPGPTWSGELDLSGISLALGEKPTPLDDLILHSPAGSTATAFDLTPFTLPLGAKQPATLEGHFDTAGYTLHLTGAALPGRLLALGDAIPQLGEGLRALLEPDQADRPVDSTSASTPIRLDLTATRTWGSPQTWHQAAAPPPIRHRHP